MKVLVNNQLIEYKDEGLGKVLLLLHGWGTDLTTFNQLSIHLSKEFRVIRFDFPGFGQSPKPDDSWLVEDYSRLTRDLVKKLKIERVYAIIGHSFGCRVIIKGLSLGYFNPKKVVLIGAAGVKSHQGIKKSIYKSIAKVGKLVTSMPIVDKIQPSLRRYLYNSAGSTDYLNSKQMQKIFTNVINEDLLPEVSKVTQSTLLIWGRDDRETPPSDANLILKSLANGELIVIPDAGHFVYIDAYDKVAKEMDKFLV